MWLQCTRTTKIHNRCSSLLVLLKIRVTSTTGAAQLIECDFYAYFSMKNGSVISSKSPSEGQRALSCWNSTYARRRKVMHVVPGCAPSEPASVYHRAFTQRVWVIYNMHLKKQHASNIFPTWEGIYEPLVPQNTTFNNMFLFQTHLALHYKYTLL